MRWRHYNGLATIQFVWIGWFRNTNMIERHDSELILGRSENDEFDSLPFPIRSGPRPTLFSARTLNPSKRPFGSAGGRHDTFTCDMVISSNSIGPISPGKSSSVCTIVGLDLGPSPAGLNAEICIE
ncbi:hypothetical protein DERF_014773 [Dermatophagoides farinae]|uniref:Uncharacterized protein n=1 Tax=Dermatophagoides farinae TaxID=6954 RepID=A0A922HPQ6_DERFA|nr:hypothetical protein DERF_014773 [Dermatophagoides farinae]